MTGPASPHEPLAPATSHTPTWAPAVPSTPRPVSRAGARPRPATAPRLALLAAAAATIAVLAAGVGPVELEPARLFGSLAHALGLEGLARLDAQDEAILWSLRLPRVALGALVGAALATGGVAMQAVARNPLADPSLVGVASGASAGACAFLVVGAPMAAALPTLGPWLLPASAFGGALTAAAAALALARSRGQLAAAALLLGGVAIAALGGALTGLLVFLADDAQLRSITFWSLGSVAGASWPVVLAVAMPTALAGAALWRATPALDRLLLGEAEARHLGVDVRRAVALAVTMTALAVGAAVAACGVIGFVGLVVPHLARSWVGPGHRALLPAAMLGGAGLLVAADALARTVAAPAELPVGVLTALAGAPLLLSLVRRRARLAVNEGLS